LCQHPGLFLINPKEFLPFDPPKSTGSQKKIKNRYEVRLIISNCDFRIGIPVVECGPEFRISRFKFGKTPKKSAVKKEILQLQLPSIY